MMAQDISNATGCLEKNSRLFQNLLEMQFFSTFLLLPSLKKRHVVYFFMQLRKYRNFLRFIFGQKNQSPAGLRHYILRDGCSP